MVDEQKAVTPAPDWVIAENFLKSRMWELLEKEMLVFIQIEKEKVFTIDPLKRDIQIERANSAQEFYDLIKVKIMNTANQKSQMRGNNG